MGSTYHPKTYGEEVTGAYSVMEEEFWADTRTAHAPRRLSEGAVRMITICSPPGLERLFEVVAELGEEELLADPNRLIALAAEGAEILGDYPAE